MGAQLLERDGFLDELATLLDKTASGAGQCALIIGEAGIGKSALIERFAELHSASARFLWGRCEALFTPRPLGPLYDIARQLPGELLDLLHQEASRAAIFSAFLEALSDSPQPTVVVFEDVHWADEATLDLLKFLGRRVQQAPVLLIGAYRDDEVTPGHPLWFVLGDLPSKTTKRLYLPPLSNAAVASLAAQAHAARYRGSAAIAELRRVTGGNPFFVTEALASATTDPPESVRAAVLARAARLSPQGYAVLEVASVVPAHTEWWLLEALTSQPASAVDECVKIGVLHVEPDAVAFRHELARQAVESTLSPRRRKELHAEVLRALLATKGETPSVARLVHHATLADDAAAILRFAPEAARQAAKHGAHREAAIHYAAALQCAATLTKTQRADLLEGRAYECYLTSQLEEAVQAYMEALQLWRAVEQANKVGNTLRWLSRINWFLGEKAAAERYAAEAIETLAALPPNMELGMAYSNLAQLRMLESDVPAALHWGVQAAELAMRLGDDEMLTHALNNMGTAQYAIGDEQGRARLETSLQIALEHGFEEHAARAFTNLGCCAVMTRQYGLARQYFDDGITYTTEHDLDSWRLYMTGWRAQTRLEVGDWDGAALDAAETLDSYRLTPVSRFTALVSLAWIRLRRGDPGADPLLDEARAMALQAGEPQRIVPIAAARAEAAWLRGDSDACQAEARAGYELVAQHASSWDLGRLSYWLWKSGAHFDPPADLPEPYALQCAGDWRGAAQVWVRLGCPYERALALAEGGLAGKRMALQLLEQLGARATVGWLRRSWAGSAERAAGLPRGPRPSTRENPAGLTRQQMNVLALLAEGQSNAEIAATLQVSPSTVEHHVSAVLAKLNARSRTQAVAQAAKIGVGAKIGARESPK